jgi:crotonobetainyl-CoA:carnitine CoA-transferase CaiB-like acyl-CoA transferase
MESILDFQFEVITTYLNDGGQLPQRSTINNAHAYLGAPYGIYDTQDGFIALAMGSVIRLGELLGCAELADFTDVKSYFTERDRIKAILREHLVTRTTEYWLSILEPADIWCSDVFTWHKLMQHESFKVLDFIQEVSRREGVTLQTTRCPIRIDGEIYKSPKGAPSLGQHTSEILAELLSAARK